MATYKTPGVYLEEVSSFPSSVAPVATAIPAFIGYTEKAENEGMSLRNIPTKIDSFPEFVLLFGSEPPRTTYIQITPSGGFVRARFAGENYILYDAIRLFYQNGGRECYIVSVGNYETAISLGNIANPQNEPGILVGLHALRKYEEPTLLLSPDAVFLPNIDLYTFQQDALMQCAELQDRFAIMDLHQPDSATWENTVEDFRNRIGISNLNYGASYFPWLKTSLPITLDFRDVTITTEDITDPAFFPDDDETRVNLFNLTTSDAIRQLIFDLINAQEARDAFMDGNNAVGSIDEEDDQITPLEEQFNEIYQDFFLVFSDASNNDYPDLDNLVPVYRWALDLLLTLRNVYLTLPNAVGLSPVPASDQDSLKFRLRSDIEDRQTQIRLFFERLVQHHREILRRSTNVLDLFNEAAPGDLNDALTFLGYNPANISSVLTDENTLNRYLAIDARNRALVALLVTANNAAAAAGATTATLVDSISTILSVQELTDQIHQPIEAQIADPANITIVDVLADLDATDTDNLPLQVAIAYVQGLIDSLPLLDGTDPKEDLQTLLGADEIPRNIIDLIRSQWADIVRVANITANVGGSTVAQVRTAIENEINRITAVGNQRREFIRLAAEDGLLSIRGLINSYNSFHALAIDYEETFNKSLLQGFGAYKQIIGAATQGLVELPPSSAIAGVYSTVDARRGVFKAPANVSLNSVLGPTIVISQQEQENLNVDVNAGKSINAIRSFKGKGVLVWGTRTLEGNSNEWRYIPVRRFFLFAEQSIKKATEPFVFEPNDANTWTKIKAMISNFLTLQWREGALAGAKPNQAFYVRVGLGETMNSFDILEGRMIVEVGLAVVRPAEFIILRFSHKMQES